jgi:ATP-dependent Clp protease ATP-binding subunit ClpA
MTSNVGSQHILKGIKEDLSQDDIKEIVQEALKENFKPEFLNRINEYIIFKPLTSEELLQVLSIKLAPTAKALYQKYQLSFEISDSAKTYIVESTRKQEFGFSPRELTRMIDEEIVDPLSQTLLNMEIQESYKGQKTIPVGGKVNIDFVDPKLSIHIIEAANETDL